MATCLAGGAAAEPSAADLPACLAKLRRGAREHHVTLADYDRLSRRIEWQAKSIEQLRSQPESVLTWQQYLDRVLTPARLERGQRIFTEWQRQARTVAARYGSDAHVIVAVWGIESDFGTRMGSFPVLDAWATLACHKPSPLRVGNFYGALRLLAARRVPAEGFTGSWSGAFGLTQFIPTSFEAYAADGDDDGTIDLYRSVPDAMASTARHLAERTRWTGGLPAAVEVVLPAPLARELAGNSDAERWVRTARPLAAWTQLGVVGMDSRPVTALGIAATTPMQVLLTAGVSGRAFLLSSNFDALTRYNQSTKYAIAVALLAQRVQQPIATPLSPPSQDTPQK